MADDDKQSNTSLADAESESPQANQAADQAEDKGARILSIPGFVVVNGRRVAITSTKRGGKFFVPTKWITIGKNQELIFGGSGLAVYQAVQFISEAGSVVGTARKNALVSSDSLFAFTMPELGNSVTDGSVLWLRLVNFNNTSFNVTIAPYLRYNEKEAETKAGSEGQGGEGQTDRNQSAEQIRQDLAATKAGLAGKMMEAMVKSGGEAMAGAAGGIAEGIRGSKRSAKAQSQASQAQAGGGAVTGGAVSSAGGGSIQARAQAEADADADVELSEEQVAAGEVQAQASGSVQTSSQAQTGGGSISGTVQTGGQTISQGGTVQAGVQLAGRPGQVSGSVEAGGGGQTIGAGGTVEGTVRQAVSAGGTAGTIIQGVPGGAREGTIKTSISGGLSAGGGAEIKTSVQAQSQTSAQEKVNAKMEQAGQAATEGSLKIEGELKAGVKGSAQTQTQATAPGALGGTAGMTGTFGATGTTGLGMNLPGRPSTAGSGSLTGTAGKGVGTGEALQPKVGGSGSLPQGAGQGQTVGGQKPAGAQVPTKEQAQIQTPPKAGEAGAEQGEVKPQAPLKEPLGTGKGAAEKEGLPSKPNKEYDKQLNAMRVGDRALKEKLGAPQGALPQKGLPKEPPAEGGGGQGLGVPPGRRQESPEAKEPQAGDQALPEPGQPISPLGGQAGEDQPQGPGGGGSPSAGQKMPEKPGALVEPPGPEKAKPLSPEDRQNQADRLARNQQRALQTAYLGNERIRNLAAKKGIQGAEQLAGMGSSKIWYWALAAYFPSWTVSFIVLDIYWFLHRRSPLLFPMRLWQKIVTVALTLFPFVLLLTAFIITWYAGCNYPTTKLGVRGTVLGSVYPEACEALKSISSSVSGALSYVSSPVIPRPLPPNTACSPVVSGPASIDALSRTCFGANAAYASLVANAESGGDPTSESRVDKCGSDSVSIGLFQINLTVHRLGELNCPSAFDRPYNGPSANCNVINRSLYNQCVQAAKTSSINIQRACEISGNGSNWQAWRTTSNKCSF